MNIFKFKQGIIGFMVGSIFFSGLTFAATTQNIEVSFDKLKFVINGVDKSTSDGQFDNQGTKVPASFIYQGTTYIPMRMVSNMLGKAVDWDGSNMAVLIGNSKGEGDYLSDLNPASLSGSNIYTNTSMKMKGQSYNKGLSIGGSYSNGQPTTTYNLNANYKTFSAYIGFEDNSYTNHFGEATTIKISGDGKDLYTVNLTPGATPQDVKIDVTGVLSLKIETNFKNAITDIANPYLTK